MAGKVVNSSLILLSKFGASRQESASKTPTSHIRKTLSSTSPHPPNRTLPFQTRSLIQMYKPIFIKTKYHNTRFSFLVLFNSPT